MSLKKHFTITLPKLFRINFLLIIGLLFFSIFSVAFAEEVSNSCRVSYDGGRTSVEGYWRNDDKNRICYTNQIISPSSEIIQTGKSQKRSKEIQNLNKTIITRSSNISKQKAFNQLRLKFLERDLEERKEKMLELAKENPAAFVTAVLSEGVKEKIPEGLKKLVEEKTEVMGDIIHFDSFEAMETGQLDYVFITSDKEVFNIYPSRGNKNIEGKNIIVSGFQFENTIVASKLTPSGTVAQFDSSTAGPIFANPNAPDIPVVGKLAVFLVEYQDSPVRPFTPQQAHDYLFNGDLNNFFKEQSYNRFSFEGDVYGWITVPQNYSGSCFNHPEFFAPGSLLDGYVLNNNIDMHEYEYVLILTNCDGGGGYAGFPSDVMINGQEYTLAIAHAFMYGSDPFSINSFSTLDNTTKLIAHELGHTLELLHAGHYDCDTEIFEFGCEQIEYGNAFDVMGWGVYGSHFNAYFKEALGWIKPWEILKIIQSGTYSLNDFETPGGIKAAKIMAPGTTIPLYYLEHRKGIGYDNSLNQAILASNQNGLIVNRNDHTQYYNPRALLLDMTPTPLRNFEDEESSSLNPSTSLQPGPVFNDTRSGITIGPVLNTLQPNNSSKVTFQIDVTTPTCQHLPPEIIDGFVWDEPIAPGEYFQIDVRFANADNLVCPGSNFNISAEFPASWNMAPASFNNLGLIQRDPENSTSVAMQKQVPTSVAPGFYDIFVTVKNLTSGLSTSRDVSIEVDF